MEVQAPKGNENQRREEGMVDISNTVLPHDIMLDILSRLPIKFLVQFRFVSKSWYKLIPNPFFANMHFSRFKKHNSYEGQLIIRNLDYDIYTLDLQGPNQSVDVKKLRLSSGESQMCCINIWGSCNGLICIQLFHVVDRKSSLYLWNPYTMEKRKIPLLKQHLLASRTRYSFGYNFIDDDYEILEVSRIEDPFKFRSAINIYSVRKNSWRTQLDIPYNVSCTIDCGAQCNGAFHWVALTSDTRRYDGECYYTLIAYEPRGEMFREILLPTLIKGGDITVYVLREKLWILHGSDLWVMSGYGVRDSWTKSLNVWDIADQVCYPVCSTDYGFIFKDRGDNLILYDPEKNTRSEIQGMSSIYEGIYCMESMVGVDINT